MIPWHKLTNKEIIIQNVYSRVFEKIFDCFVVPGILQLFVIIFRSDKLKRKITEIPKLETFSSGTFPPKENKTWVYDGVAVSIFTREVFIEESVVQLLLNKKN